MRIAGYRVGRIGLGPLYQERWRLAAAGPGGVSAWTERCSRSCGSKLARDSGYTQSRASSLPQPNHQKVVADFHIGDRRRYGNRRPPTASFQLGQPRAFSSQLRVLAFSGPPAVVHDPPRALSLRGPPHGAALRGHWPLPSPGRVIPIRDASVSSHARSNDGPSAATIARTSRRCFSPPPSR